MHNQISADAHMSNAVGPQHNAKGEAAIDPQLVIVRSVIAQSQPKQGSRPTADTKKKKAKDTRLARIMRPVLALLARPDMPRILAIVLLVVLTVLHTGLVLFMAAMAVVLALVLYFSFGPDRVRTWILRRYSTFKARDPDAADRLRRRAAWVSRAAGAVANRLPERWTQGLYLPDFEEPEEGSEKWESDPFDRLSRE